MTIKVIIALRYLHRSDTCIFFLWFSVALSPSISLVSSNHELNTIYLYLLLDVVFSFVDMHFVRLFGTCVVYLVFLVYIERSAQHCKMTAVHCRNRLTSKYSAFCRSYQDVKCHLSNVFGPNMWHE